MVSPEVTITDMTVVPTGVDMLPDGDPDVTGAPSTSIVEHVSDAVGVTVIEATLTSAVYEIVPDANAGLSVPDERVRLDRSASGEKQLVRFMV